MKVKILRKPGSAGNDGAHFPAVGEVADFPEAKANALLHYKYAEKVEDEKPEPKAEKPDENRETATDASAEQRETREADKPVKRGPGRPRKTDK